MLGSVPMMAENCARVMRYWLIRKAVEIVLMLVEVASRWKLPAGTYFSVPMLGDV